MKCRACGACCEAISITSPIPGAPNGKAAGERCLHLTDAGLCDLFGKEDRPKICGEFRPVEWMCGRSYAEAMRLISEIEKETKKNEFF
jgi:Fe-S-cluster containining protein